MQERTLFRFSLGVMLLGFLALLFLADADIVPKEAGWENHGQAEQILLQGVVQKATPVKKAYFLTVASQREESINIVFFPKEEVFLKEGDLVEVTGTSTTYQGKKEVIANKLVLLASPQKSEANATSIAQP